MPRDTDIPDRIQQLLELTSERLTSQQIATRLKITPRTARTHVLALVTRRLILRDYEYDDRGVGRWIYCSREAAKARA